MSFQASSFFNSNWIISLIYAPRSCFSVMTSSDGLHKGHLSSYVTVRLLKQASREGSTRVWSYSLSWTCVVWMQQVKPCKACLPFLRRENSQWIRWMLGSLDHFGYQWCAIKLSLISGGTPPCSIDATILQFILASSFSLPRSMD